MPFVTLGWAPRFSALPIATTSSPTCSASEDPSSAGVVFLTVVVLTSATS